IALIHEIAKLEMTQPIIILAVGASRQLQRAVSAGATYILPIPFRLNMLILALRAAEAYVLRSIDTWGNSLTSSNLWRDDQLVWDFDGDFVSISPALAELLRTNPNPTMIERFLDAFAPDVRHQINAFVEAPYDIGPAKTLQHRFGRHSHENFIHHLSKNKETGRIHGLIERATEGQVARLPRKDALTGLLKVSELRAWLSVNDSLPQAMIVVDLLGMEMVNAAFGRHTGDSVLQAIARRIERALHQLFMESQPLARLSGGTYALVISGEEQTQAGRCALLCETLSRVLHRPVIAEGHAVHLTSKITAVSRQNDESGFLFVRRGLATTIETAAVAHEIINYGPGHDTTSLDQLATDLRAALDRNEIEIVFQPQVDVATDKIIGVEALARWLHPKFGALGAGTLFAVAEKSHYVRALSAYIQRLALVSAGQWPQTLQHLRLSINITADDINMPDFLASFSGLMADINFKMQNLTIELTESSLADDLKKTASILQNLRDFGCKIAIDDFGTGYSSLAYLKNLPVDYLKIDKSLTQNIVGSARDQVIVRGAIAMAQSLGLKVIAEGVETEAQRAALAALKCDIYQGFLCAEPLSVAALERLVTS
ncbi:MAG: GGDEF domain-containing protein, partial [Alphaproteobacteria bacterium]|nr:GGDEF domain-containing protein [Alphaproteobacteria bacterium]